MEQNFIWKKWELYKLMIAYKFDIKKNIKDNKELTSGSFLLLGKFEIFHKGHEELLKWAKANRKEEKIGILLIENENNNFQTLDNKLNNLAQLGFDFVVVAIFNYEFKSIEGKDFINYLNKNFNVKTYVTGEDFRFGKDRKYKAIDIKDIDSSNIKIIEIKKNLNNKISTKAIKEMHEMGEYNLIKNMIVNDLVFDIEIIDDKFITWKQEISKPHSGNYYFKILIDNYWYHGIINFSMDDKISFQLINSPKEMNIFKQETKIKIINIQRIIINQRFDQISENDIENAKKYFNIS